MKMETIELRKIIVEKINKKDYLLRNTFGVDLMALNEQNKIFIQKKVDDDSPDDCYDNYFFTNNINHVKANDFFAYEKDGLLELYEIKEVPDNSISPSKIFDYKNPLEHSNKFFPKSLYDLKKSISDTDKSTTIRYLLKTLLKQDISIDVYYALLNAKDRNELSRVLNNDISIFNRKVSPSALEIRDIMCWLLKD